MISISTFCSKSRIYFLSLLTDFFRISTNTMDSSVEVDEKLEANICPFCTKAFNSSLQLLKHVVYKHNCLECTKTCQHKAVINQADEPIVKSEITSPENIKIEIVNEPSEEIVNTVQICDDNENLRIQDENVLIKSEFVNPIDEKNIVESPENSNFLRVRTDLFSDQATSSNNETSEKQDYSVLSKTCFKCCICKRSKYIHPKEYDKSRSLQEEDIVNHILSKHKGVTKANVKDFYQECLYYKCNHCHDYFKGEDAVKEHIKRMTKEAKEELFTCDMCDTTPTNMFCVLQKHRRHHQPFSCQICSISCNSLEELENHNKKKHSYYCKKCKFTFESQELLDDHKLNEHKYQCDICHTVCTNLQDLENHKKNKHSYNCKKCDFKCESKGLLDDHTLNQHKYQCDICQTVCNTLQALENHDKRNHKTHQCEVCEEYFYSKSTLNKHMETHGAPKECEFCQLSFPSQKSLNRHLKFAHDLKCVLCGERFTRLNCFERHKTMCFNSRPRCELCEKPFKEELDLRGHLINVHFMCYNCGTFLDTKQSLEEHKAQYRCSKFKCNRCHIGFPSEIELNSHNNSQHPNEYVASIRKANKTFVNCEQCDEKFTSQMNLKFHMEIVHSSRKRKAEETESKNSPPEKQALFGPSDSPPKPNQ